jgi:dihydroprymidine dehydrogenase-like protein
VADHEYWREQIKCQFACPVHTDARSYVRAIAAGDFEQAYLIARGPNPLASLCGRICGALCEAACRNALHDLLDSFFSFSELKVWPDATSPLNLRILGDQGWKALGALRPNPTRAPRVGAPRTNGGVESQ